MKCGIVGLPNVGKSTLFFFFCNAKAQSANYPFCTIEPNVGSVTVPDLRLNKLEELVKPEKVQPAIVDIVDIAGLVKGASKGEGLGNQFLANIRECNAIIHVLRCFENENITHVEGSVNPIRDKEIIDIELQFKDLEAVDKRLDKAKKSAKSGDKNEKAMADVLEKVKAQLEQAKNVRLLDLSETEQELVSGLQLLTNKPILYVCNVDDSSAINGNEFVEKVKENIKNEQAEIIILTAQTEADISELETYEERQMFLEEIGLEEPGVNKLIRSAYSLLNLQTYFTAGVKEVRAWTILKGSTAPQAASVIHTDFEKGFIRAEVIKYDDFVLYGSELKVKEAGKLSVEGKEYIVQDGDIMHFRFNV